MTRNHMLCMFTRPIVIGNKMDFNDLALSFAPAHAAIGVRSAYTMEWMVCDAQRDRIVYKCFVWEMVWWWWVSSQSPNALYKRTISGRMSNASSVVHTINDGHDTLEWDAHHSRGHQTIVNDWPTGRCVLQNVMCWFSFRNYVTLGSVLDFVHWNANFTAFSILTTRFSRSAYICEPFKCLNDHFCDVSTPLSERERALKSSWFMSLMVKCASH